MSICSVQRVIWQVTEHMVIIVQYYTSTDVYFILMCPAKCYSLLCGLNSSACSAHILLSGSIPCSAPFSTATIGSEQLSQLHCSWPLYIGCSLMFNQTSAPATSVHSVDRGTHYSVTSLRCFGTWPKTGSEVVYRILYLAPTLWIHNLRCTGLTPSQLENYVLIKIS